MLIHKVALKESDETQIYYCMFETAAGLNSAVNMGASFVFIFYLNMKTKLLNKLNFVFSFVTMNVFSQLI